jgi:2-amino-4-hydroxy-6-hydroxymethyldihydropteridine diphosphokinase
MHIAYLLTGGNLGDREATLTKAKDLIALNCGPILSESPLYETEAWGIEDQELFLNQALKIRTELSAPLLLEEILSIEKQLGRVRQIKYGPRKIDIDILFFDHDVIHEPGLTVPHPHLQTRRFALQCLFDIAPGLVHPLFDKTITRLLAECTDPLKVYKLG